MSKLTRTKEYRAWESIKQRCVNPKCENYQWYGARGIKCLYESFQAFLEDVGYAPPNHSIDRIDNNGHYTVGNCRWATGETQHNNKRSNVNLTHHGKTQTIAVWARELTIPKTTIRMRKERGLSDSECLSKEPIAGCSISAFGQTRYLYEWVKITGMNKSTIRARLLRGMTPEEALSKPLFLT